MQPFTLTAPTRVHFGKRALTKLPRIAVALGFSRLLIVTGKGSSRKNGAWDQLKEQLDAAGKKHGLEWQEYSEIPSDPTVDHAAVIARAAKDFRAQALAPVGGGSVIDATKAAAAVLGKDLSGHTTPSAVWQLLEQGKDITSALPLLAASTLAGSGSEANSDAVISDPHSGETRSLRGPALFPAVAFIDPALQLNLPWEQTRRGVVDACSHVLERYVPALFHIENAPALPVEMSEALLRSLLQTGETLHHEPDNLAARANLCMGALQAQSGFIPAALPEGDWTCHVLSHAFKDGRTTPPAHGDLLPLLLTSWLGLLAALAPGSLDRFAQTVLGEESGPAGINVLREIFQEWGAPEHLGALGLDRDAIAAALQRAKDQGLRHGGLGRALPMQERLAGLLELCTDASAK